MEVKLESQARSLSMKQTEIETLNLRLFEKGCDVVLKIAEGLGITGRGETKKTCFFFMSSGACKLGEQCPFIQESKNVTDKKKQPNQRENTPANKVCKYFKGGSCYKKRTVISYTYAENTN